MGALTAEDADVGFEDRDGHVGVERDMRGDERHCPRKLGPVSWKRTHTKGIKL